jgi:hypothetical protein
MLASLFMHLTGVSYLRLIRKFMEKSHEKIYRLLELYRYYDDKVYAQLQKLQQEQPDQEYMLLLEHGVTSLEYACMLLALLLTAQDAELQIRTEQLLHQYGTGVHSIYTVLKRQTDNLLLDDKPEGSESELKKVNLLNGLTNMLQESVFVSRSPLAESE